jgi:hypothetical protein
VTINDAIGGCEDELVAGTVECAEVRKQHLDLLRSRRDVRPSHELAISRAMSRAPS